MCTYICIHTYIYTYIYTKLKCKIVLRQAEVALGVPGWLRHRIFSTFGTTRVVDRQHKRTGHLYLRRNPWY